MSRPHLARGALAALLLLTALTAWIGHGGAPAPLAALAFVKAAIIGAVFLELDHAPSRFGAAAGFVVAVVVGGAAWATAG